MDQQDLLNTLVEQNLLSADQVEKLAREAGVLNKTPEALMYERRLVDEKDVARIKSFLLKVPYQAVNHANVSQDVLDLLPEETVVNYKVIPIGRDRNMLIVGMINPDDRRAQEALKFIAKQKKLSLGVYLITPEDFSKVQRRYSPYATDVKAAVLSMRVKPSDGASGVKKVKLEQAIGASEEAPIIRIVSSTLKEAVASGASDIHVEPQKTRLRIRFRIDGSLKEVESLPPELHQPIISRIKILSNLKIDENRIPQDGRFRTEIFGRDIDFRISTFPTPAGEKVALRVLDPEIGLKTLPQLGLLGYSGSVVEKGMKEPYGMIIISGPTGSGKTTTLYALMQQLNTEDVNIVSLEDPVEYSIEGVNQSQVRPEIGYTFASGLRQILRQDPDVMMVGEIRDEETAELAVHAALTGHVVLATLHTNNATSVIPRLIDMNVDSFLLPSTLNLMVSQRLVTRMCQECKQHVTPSQDIQDIIAMEIHALSSQMQKSLSYTAPYTVWEAHGCKACKGTGRSGRVALFEVLTMTNELSRAISRETDELKIKDEARRQEMITLRQDGILKALEGLVMIEEVLRETSADQ